MAVQAGSLSKMALKPVRVPVLARSHGAGLAFQRMMRPCMVRGMQGQSMHGLGFVRPQDCNVTAQSRCSVEVHVMSILNSLCLSLSSCKSYTHCLSAGDRHTLRPEVRCGEHCSDMVYAR